MIAAIIIKLIIFENIGVEGIWEIWYIREISTAMLIANLTLCFPLSLAIYRGTKLELTSGRFSSRFSKMSRASKASQSDQDSQLSRRGE
jgi:hypothetical protein